MSNSEIKKHADEGRYLCFSLGSEKFAIPLLQVKEVLGKLNLTSIPSSPPYFKGVVNLRGQIISVIDLRLKLKSGSKPAESVDASTIILDFGPLALGMTVDTVDSVREYKKADLSPPPDIESSVKSEYILSVAKEEGGLVLVLNLESLLNANDYKVLEQQKVA